MTETPLAGPFGVPPPFGPSYEKARRAYTLCGALLLAWELIGLDVRETPIESLHVTLKSPQAVPYVLIALVGYCAFRFAVEWYQADPDRRRRWVSRADYAVAHVIGMASIALYLFQAMLQTQLVDKLQPGVLAAFVEGSMAGAVVGGLFSISNDPRAWLTELRAFPRLLIGPILAVGMSVLFAKVRVGSVVPNYAALIVGAVISAPLMYVMVRWEARSTGARSDSPQTPA